jgi:hypothetical protein
LENNDTPPSAEQIKAMKYEDLWQIYILNPDSKRCQAIIPALAGKFIEKDDYAGAFSLLRSAWEAAPSSASCLALLTALEQQGEWGVAKQLLFEAREKIGAQPAPQNGTWNKFADAKMAAEPYLSAPIFAPEFKISASEKYFYKFPQEINTTAENLDLSQAPNSLMVAGSTADRQYQITTVDAAAGKMLWMKPAYAYGRSILFDKYLVLLGSGTRIFDRQTGSELKSLGIYTQNASIIRDKLFLYGNNASEISIYNVQDLKEIGKFNIQKIFGTQRGGYYGYFAFQPMDDTWIMAWNINGMVTGINIKDGKPMAMTQLGGQQGGQCVWAGKSFGRDAMFWRSVANVRTLVSVNVETGKQTVLGQLIGVYSIPREVLNLSENTQLHITMNGLDKVALEGGNSAPQPKKIWSTPPGEAYACNPSLVSGTTAYAIATNQKELVEISLKDGTKRAQTKLLNEQVVTFDTGNYRGNAIAFNLLLHSGRYLVYKMALAPKERYFGTEPSFCRVVIYDKMLHQNVWQRDFIGLTVCGAKSWNGSLYLLTNDGNLYRYGD